MDAAADWLPAEACLESRWLAGLVASRRGQRERAVELLDAALEECFQGLRDAAPLGHGRPPEVLAALELGQDLALAGGEPARMPDPKWRPRFEELLRRTGHGLWTDEWRTLREALTR
jgi:hypothetical protein